MQAPPFESRLGRSHDGRCSNSAGTRGSSHPSPGLHICSPRFQVRVQSSKADGGQTPPVSSFFLTTARPPIRIPRTPLNHKRPYDNAIICHLITQVQQVQQTHETCHRRPFNQKLARCGPLVHRPSAYTKNIVVWHKEREREKERREAWSVNSNPPLQHPLQHPLSDYSDRSYGHFQTPPLQNASTTDSCKPK